MFGFPDWLNPGSRPFQLLGALQSGRQQDRAQRQYQNLQDQQYADALAYASQMGPEQLNTYDAAARQQQGVLERLAANQQAGARRLQGQQTRRLQGRTADVMADYNSGANNYQQGLQNFLSSYGGDTQNLLQGYKDRYNTAAKDLENYGAQQKADINESFDKQKAAAVNNLNERGWANSTVMPSVDAQFEKERSAEQRRLGEDLTRMKTGILANLSGDTLNAQGNRYDTGSGYGFTGMGQELTNNMGRANLRAGLTGDEANSAAQLGLFGLQNDAQNQGNLANFWGGNAANRSNIVGSGMGTYLNTLTDMNYIPPQSNAGVMNQFGANMVQGPNAPNPLYSLAGPAIQGGLTAGGMMLAGPPGAMAGNAAGGGGNWGTPNFSDALPPNGVGQPGGPTGPPSYKRRPPMVNQMATMPNRGYRTTKRMIGAR